MSRYKVKAVFFSPTGNTGKAVMKVAETISDYLDGELETVDFTLPEARLKRWAFDDKTISVFGTPVYAGRVPNKILPFIKEGFQGRHSFAVPLVTFGNRSYDDALSELRDLLEGNEFRTIAGAAVVGRHPFSSLLANDRPDADDLSTLSLFAEEACLKIADYTKHTPVKVKGTSPAAEYYKPKGLDGRVVNFLRAKPKTDAAKCTQCRICVGVCPMGSIDSSDVSSVSGICIKCHACILKCPANAKYFDDPGFLSHAAMLDKNYIRRTENDFFI